MIKLFYSVYCKSIDLNTFYNLIDFRFVVCNYGKTAADSVEKSIFFNDKLLT